MSGLSIPLSFVVPQPQTTLDDDVSELTEAGADTVQPIFESDAPSPVPGRRNRERSTFNQSQFHAATGAAVDATR